MSLDIVNNTNIDVKNLDDATILIVPPSGTENDRPVHVTKAGENNKAERVPDGDGASIQYGKFTKAVIENRGDKGVDVHLS